MENKLQIIKYLEDRIMRYNLESIGLESDSGGDTAWEKRMGERIAQNCVSIFTLIDRIGEGNLAEEEIRHIIYFIDDLAEEFVYDYEHLLFFGGMDNPRRMTLSRGRANAVYRDVQKLITTLKTEYNLTID